MTKQTEIEINGKKFKLETNGLDADGRTRYLLTGQRGAKYGTMRNAKNTNIIFLINLRGFGLAPGFENTYLTDSRGTLEKAEVLWVSR